MKLEKLIQECKDLLQEEAGCQYDIDDWFDAILRKPSVWITCSYRQDKCEVYIEHTHNDHHSDNIEEYLSGELSGCVDWDEIRAAREEYDEWKSHGFTDMADYLRWRYC